jgi:hypothetical protein
MLMHHESNVDDLIRGLPSGNSHGSLAKEAEGVLRRRPNSGVRQIHHPELHE